jgi:CMP-N-acetylneuraminic acid synthetase
MGRKKTGVTLGIIPARGGSRGIPRKNIKSLCGRPLIYYTINAAKKSKYLNDFVVTTDDETITEIAEKYGAKTIKRPPALAKDDTPMASVVSHAINFYENDGPKVDIIILLQPTSPLRSSEDIDRALKLLGDSGADAVISVYRVSDSHPARMYTLDSGRLIPCEPKLQFRRRQDLPPVYLRNGALYIIKSSVFMKKNSFFVKNTYAYIMPRERSINIDEEIDVLLAELLIKNNA